MKCLRTWPAVVAAALALGSPSSRAAELTALESRWLQGAQPVLAYARAAAMPLDVIVQPQPTPGAAPLALAFVGGRCKLVLSMRGNPDAATTLGRIAPELLDATLELMAAHELGHCRRYLDGAWYTLPAGFAAGTPEGVSPEIAKAYLAMQATRREEGYGDLVALAWTQAQRPQQYARLHAWLVAERSRDLIDGSHHDTLAWVRLAADGRRLAHGSIFDAAARLWPQGFGEEP